MKKIAKIRKTVPAGEQVKYSKNKIRLSPT